MPRQSSVASIRARIRALQTQARRLERNATKGLRAVAAAIAKHGLSRSEVQQAFGMTKGGRKRSPVAGRAVAIKYKDDKGNTWTGRGRTPLWLVAAEKAGKKRQSFLIGVKKTPSKSKSKKARSKKPSDRKSSEPASNQSAG
jgi:DNA-binding protein H-NS